VGESGQVAALIDQRLEFLHDAHLVSRTNWLLKYLKWDDEGYTRQGIILIFLNTRIGVEKVARTLQEEGVRATVLHGGLNQKVRSQAMLDFRTGEASILVSSAVAARGIDIPNVSCVINLDCPLKEDNYVHQIGRCGRNGKKGLAITIVTGEDRELIIPIVTHIKKSHNNTRIPTEVQAMLPENRNILY